MNLSKKDLQMIDEVLENKIYQLKPKPGETIGENYIQLKELQVRIQEERDHEN